MSVLQGLCSFNEKLYAAWKGEVGDDRLFFSCFNGPSGTHSRPLVVTAVPGQPSQSSKTRSLHHGRVRTAMNESSFRS